MIPQRIPPELLAMTPPTVAMSVEAGIGPEPAAVGSEDAVDVAEHGAGPDPDAGAVVEDLDPAPVAANVDEDAVGLGLAVEAGAAGAEDERRADAAATSRISPTTWSTVRGWTTAAGIRR